MRAINEAIEGADAYGKMMDKIREDADAEKRDIVSALRGDFVVKSPAAEVRCNETRKQRRARLREESKRARRAARIGGLEIQGVIVDELATLRKVGT